MGWTHTNTHSIIESFYEIEDQVGPAVNFFLCGLRIFVVEKFCRHNPIILRDHIRWFVPLALLAFVFTRAFAEEFKVFLGQWEALYILHERHMKARKQLWRLI